MQQIQSGVEGGAVSAAHDSLSNSLGVGLLALSLFSFAGCGSRDAGSTGKNQAIGGERVQTQAERDAANGFYDRGNGVFFIMGSHRVYEVADHMSAFRKANPDLKIVEIIQDNHIGFARSGLIVITEPATVPEGEGL